MFIAIRTKTRALIFGKLKGYDKETLLMSLLIKLMERGMTKDDALRCLEVANNKVRDKEG